MEWKLKLFGHICRMDDNRLVKNVVFGIIDGLNRRGRPRREWMDERLQIMVLDRRANTQHHRAGVETVVMEALDTNGPSP